LRWSVLPAGILQANGVQTIQTSTGTLTLATAAGAGDVQISPNGVGTLKADVGAGSEITLLDGGTNTIANTLTLRHNSSGTPLASFGGAMRFQLQSSTTANRAAASVEALWTNPADATRSSALALRTVNAGGALTEFWRQSAIGTWKSAGVYTDYLGGNFIDVTATQTQLYGADLLDVELVTNGTFTGSLAGWTVTGAVVYGVNNAVVTMGPLSLTSYGVLEQVVVIPSAGFYQVSWKQTHSVLNNGLVKVQSSGGAVPFQAGYVTAPALAAVTYSSTLYVTAAGNLNLYVNISTASVLGCSGTITLDDISIKKILNPLEPQLQMDYAAVRTSHSSSFSFVMGDSASGVGGGMLGGNRQPGMQANIILGAMCASPLRRGGFNILLGTNNAAKLSDSNYVIAIGSSCLQQPCANMDHTIAIGNQPFSFFNGGSANVGIGAGAFLRLIYGSYNVAIGYYAGNGSNANNNCLVTGSDNIFLGRYSGCTAISFADISKSIVLGVNAWVGASNTCIIGGTGADLVYVGLGGLTTAHSYLTVGGSFAFAQVTVTAAGPTTLTAAHQAVWADTTSNNVDFVLPTAVGIGGRQYTIKKVAVANSVTVSCAGAETIDGSATQVILNQYVSMTVESNGTNWYIV